MHTGKLFLCSNICSSSFASLSENCHWEYRLHFVFTLPSDKRFLLMVSLNIFPGLPNSTYLTPQLHPTSTILIISAAVTWTECDKLTNFNRHFPQRFKVFQPKPNCPTCQNNSDEAHDSPSTSVQLKILTSAKVFFFFKILIVPNQNKAYTKTDKSNLDY